jgi:alginate O-acetyltransferase complex protein AlgI
MLFNSIEFLIFFPVVTILFFMLPQNWRWFLLLVASCVFYMAFIPVYILILAITIAIDYSAGIWIEKTGGNKRKIFLVISIVSTCLVLFIFKYYNFFNANFGTIAKFFHWNYPVGILKIILPIGLSFHTFQSLSYVIEVYRGNQKAEKHFGIYALYVMFYPQLVAGPIERPQNLLHQFYEEHHFEYRRVTDGLKLMAWGMFKKVVVADRLAVFVNQVYNNPADYTGLQLITATIFFAFQIYCDFSGYSDIAIGSAQVMGFKLMDNFKRPYFSKSISEFWKRWHISLSSWFKDYLYIPLGGNRVSTWRIFANIFVTFLISGFWHGANWTFVIWGALNGVYLIGGIATQNIRGKLVNIIGLNKLPRLHKYVQVSITFALICFSWIFFRANSVGDAFYIVSHLMSGLKSFIVDLIRGLSNLSLLKIAINPLLLNQTKLQFFIAVFSIAIVEVIHLQQRHGSIRRMLATKPVLFRWFVYYALIFGILFLGAFQSSTQFIYFQF